MRHWSNDLVEELYRLRLLGQSEVVTVAHLLPTLPLVAGTLFAGGRSAFAFHREIIRPGICRTSLDQAGIRRQPLEDATDPREKNLFGVYQRPDDFADRAGKTPNVNALKRRSNPATCFFICSSPIIYYWNSKVIW